MKIAIIGAGRVGTTLGARFAAGGHEIVYGVRDPSDPKHGALGAVAAPDAAARDADLVVVALPWDAVESVVRAIEVGDAVVVDATNPLAANARELQQHPERSGASLVAEWSRSPRVVKAFNITGAGNMADPAYPGGRAAMLVAGDDADAKAVVVGLADQIGFDVVDAGPLDAATDLEHLAMIWIRLAYPLGTGPDFAFSVLRR